MKKTQSVLIFALLVFSHANYAEESSLGIEISNIEDLKVKYEQMYKFRGKLNFKECSPDINFAGKAYNWTSLRFDSSYIYRATEVESGIEEVAFMIPTRNVEATANFEQFHNVQDAVLVYRQSLGNYDDIFLSVWRKKENEVAEKFIVKCPFTALRLVAY